MGTYAVKEIFLTLQGEGANAGRAAVFCRFAGCNLWTGREEDRAEALCDFCDTDFVGTDGPGGGRYPSPQTLADAIDALWPTKVEHSLRECGSADRTRGASPLLCKKLVVCT